MMRYLSLIAPYLIGPQRRVPARKLAGLAIAYAAIAAAVIFLLIAIYIWLLKHYGVELALVAIALLLLVSASIALFVMKRPNALTSSTTTSSSDPLSDYLPDSVTENPTIKKILGQVSENPMTAVSVAVILGALLSKEFFDD